MKQPSLGLAALSIAGTVACAPTADVEAERAALREADAAYTQAVAAKDVERWSAFYTADAKLYPPNDSTVTGIDAIRAFGAEFTAMPNFSATFHPLEVDVGSGGDLGYTLNHYVITVDGPDGRPVTEQGRDFHVWRKQVDGSWKVVIDIWNSEQPAAPVR
jgi:ketosteroid isomerase-like protein